MERNTIMANTYKKPETKIVKIELQQMIADSIPTGESGSLTGAESKKFDFFSFEEEEEAPGKSDDDDDWEDWEEEE